MIKAKELRIGNYILADNVIKKICSIKNDEDIVDVGYVDCDDENQFGHEACDSEKLQYIPLSNKVLEQFGFNFHSHFHLWQRTRPPGSYSIELDSDFAALDFMHRPIVKQLKFVHTMQNLFYSIQGIELAFNNVKAS